MNCLIKYSGEFFDAKDSLTKIGQEFLDTLANCKPGYIVVGGGNRIRGRSSKYNRVVSDRIGVLSTLMNGFILNEHFRLLNIKSRVFTHFSDYGNFYSAEKAIEAHERGEWVIFAGGLGHVAFVSTDVNSIIKALEVNVDVVVKITKEGYVFDKDPLLEDAQIVYQLSHSEVLKQNLAIMDFAAIALAQEHNLPIIVTSIAKFPEILNGSMDCSVIGKYHSSI